MTGRTLLQLTRKHGLHRQERKTSLFVTHSSTDGNEIGANFIDSSTLKYPTYQNIPAASLNARPVLGPNAARTTRRAKGALAGFLRTTTKMFPSAEHERIKVAKLRGAVHTSTEPYSIRKHRSTVSPSTATVSPCLRWIVENAPARRDAACLSRGSCDRGGPHGESGAFTSVVARSTLVLGALTASSSSQLSVDSYEASCVSPAKPHAWWLFDPATTRRHLLLRCSSTIRVPDQRV